MNSRQRLPEVRLRGLAAAVRIAPGQSPSLPRIGPRTGFEEESREGVREGGLRAVVAAVSTAGGPARTTGFNRSERVSVTDLLAPTSADELAHSGAPERSVPRLGFLGVG